MYGFSNAWKNARIAVYAAQPPLAVLGLLLEDHAVPSPEAGQGVLDRS